MKSSLISTGCLVPHKRGGAGNKAACTRGRGWLQCQWGGLQCSSAQGGGAGCSALLHKGEGLVAAGTYTGLVLEGLGT